MAKAKQLDLLPIHWQHRHQHGGVLRNKRKGRGARPLSTRDPLHIVFKANRAILRRPVTHTLTRRTIRQYAKHFEVKVEQLAIAANHIHLLIRCSQRVDIQSFLKVVAGQICQRVTGAFTKPAGLTPPFWKHRPFTRVIKGLRPYQVVRAYVRLNQKEAAGERPFRIRRLKGLTPEQINSLWD